MHPIGTILEENNNEAPSCGNTTRAKTGAEKKNQAKHPKTASNLDKILQHIAPEDKATPAAVDINVGYAAAVHIGVIDSSNKMAVSLMTWKSNVASSKVEHIPRIELCGAVLSNRLVILVKQSYEFSNHTPTYCRIESTIALSWFGDHLV
ncbi:hypothetical protein GQX74_004938 [Glossina fuscipes]|nr:hypothetical protein GQX74_004938 [Glossina fuscipes]